MAQHKASRRAVLRSSMKHKYTADLMLDTMEELTTNIAAVRAKIAADTDGTWDTDYVATAGVVAVDFDSKSVGQHKQTARKVIIDKMAHRKLGDEMVDLLEESQVTLNLILAQMDADAGTLSDDATYEAYRIADPIKVDSVFQGPHKANFEKMMVVSVKHREYGKSIAYDMQQIQAQLNIMIDDIQAKNA